MASGQPIPQIRKVAKPEDILAARATVNKVWIDEKVRDYLVDVARATRSPAEFGVAGLDGMIEVGASPRASINLMKAAKAHAFLQNRGYVTPHDVKSVAMEVLRHRVILTYEAEAEGKSNDDIIQKVLDNVPVP
jgi:MoxR-like ATPase